MLRLASGWSNTGDQLRQRADFILYFEQPCETYEECLQVRKLTNHHKLFEIAQEISGKLTVVIDAYDLVKKLKQL